MKRRHVLKAAGASALVAAGMPLRAATTTKIAYGYTASTDFCSLFAAVDKGMFAKRGIEVEPQLLTLNATMPAALQSGSLQIAGITTPTFLQAVDAGLDLAVVGGGGCYQGGPSPAGLVARPGVEIRSAGDAVGKVIGVPGIGTILHVVLRGWLLDAGVDIKKVRFIEMPLPQQADVLRSGAVDAVVTVDPFMSRIIESGAGRFAVDYFVSFPKGNPSALHVATRSWVEKNKAAAVGFHEAILEGAAYVSDPANDAEVRALVGKYNRVPPQVLPKIVLLSACPKVTAPHLKFWEDLMSKQDLLKRKLDLASLIAQP